MSDEPRDAELETVLRLFAESATYGLRVAMPGKITSYDSTKQSASVKPLIMDTHVDESDARKPVSLPEVHSVPVMMLGPARGRITWPVAAGDLCLLLFCSSSISRWLTVGGEVDPGDDRRHDINDAVAVVGLHSYKSIPTTAPTDALVLHAGAGTKVKVGGPNGTEPTIMADTFVSKLDDVLIALIAAVNSVLAGAAATAEAKRVLLMAPGAGIKTTKTEVK